MKKDEIVDIEDGEDNYDNILQESNGLRFNCDEDSCAKVEYLYDKKIIKYDERICHLCLFYFNSTMPRTGKDWCADAVASARTDRHNPIVNKILARILSLKWAKKSDAITVCRGYNPEVNTIIVIPTTSLSPTATKSLKKRVKDGLKASRIDLGSFDMGKGWIVYIEDARMIPIISSIMKGGLVYTASVVHRTPAPVTLKELLNKAEQDEVKTLLFTDVHNCKDVKMHKANGVSLELDKLLKRRKPNAEYIKLRSRILETPTMQIILPTKKKGEKRLDTNGKPYQNSKDPFYLFNAKLWRQNKK